MEKNNQTEFENHWVKDDVFNKILQALESASLDVNKLSIKDLSPVDHYHAMGFRATRDLAKLVDIRNSHHILDIGCGIGGPARYIADQYGCQVIGVDITAEFVDIAKKLTAMVAAPAPDVKFQQADGHALPFENNSFDGAISQHVTMNVANRRQYFSEAFRVLKTGGFLVLTEQGLGSAGKPIFPVPWSEDGKGSHLIAPETTLNLLESTGFNVVSFQSTGKQYEAGYNRMSELMSQNKLPQLGVHLLMGNNSIEKISNSGTNIAEGRIKPFTVLAYKS